MTTPELPEKWAPTHLVKHDSGRENRVMLTPSGAAYTRGDWAVRKASRHATIYSVLTSGLWLYRGAPLKGSVVPL